MKTIHINSVKTEYFLLYLIATLSLCATILFFKQYQAGIKTISPFYMNLNVGEDTEQQDLDNNLSGNSGISMDYYSKQLDQLLNSTDSLL